MSKMNIKKKKEKSKLLDKAKHHQKKVNFHLQWVEANDYSSTSTTS